MGQAESTLDGSTPRPMGNTHAEVEAGLSERRRLKPRPEEDRSVSSDEHSKDASVDKGGGVDAPASGPPQPEIPMKESSKKVKAQLKEDEINQDQEKQDLLAYLQIVGEHSSSLPFTWRDDPLLGRTVSNLTSKEYARKADAFIPCDIRVIGATPNNIDRTDDRDVKDVSEYYYLVV